MAPKTTKRAAGKRVESLTHAAEKRRNIPTAETQSFMAEDEAAPKTLLYPRNPDLDPQLVWRGKDAQDRGPLAVDTVPIYIQEKVHPKAIVDDLKRLKANGSGEAQADLFADFNGIAVEDKLDFYQHQQNWSNRMILGDGLLVMNSLAEKEKLRGRVQMIYIDPPYGIKFGSNWQPSTKKRDVTDGRAEDFSREPEVIKAFRDTWAQGVHSYLSYLRDRLLVARELLTESGSVFVQIGDENVHRVRAVMDEVFGEQNYVDQIVFQTSSGRVSDGLDGVYDVILWFAKLKGSAKIRRLKKARTEKQLDTAYTYVQLEDGTFRTMNLDEREGKIALPATARRFRPGQTQSQSGGESSRFEVKFEGNRFPPPTSGGWRTSPAGFERAACASRLMARGRSIAYRLCDSDNPMIQMTNIWTDTVFVSFGSEKAYIVQTNPLAIQRCLLMTTDPGDLVLDPTCGSGTTAYVAEQWGRRWITIDTSRVALALARTRLMAARFPYYLLADSKEGQRKEGELAGKPPSEKPTAGDIRRGFVYERVPHVTLKSIANNAEIDVIHEKWQRTLEPLRAAINAALGTKWEEWEVPRSLDDATPGPSPQPSPAKGGRGGQKAAALVAQWWEARRARQKEIDASIARNADTEFLYDRPYEDRNTVRVTGPFTVESLSPHRVLPTDQEDEAILDALDAQARERGEVPPPRPPRRKLVETGGDDFVRVVIENLRSAGVQNTKKKERLVFTELKPWAGGKYIHAEGRYEEGGKERRAAITIGPEYGTVSYQLVRDAAREAKDLFDVLVVCGFAFEPHVGEETMSLGRLVVLKARMNQDLHMAEHLKKTGAGNLFVVFGEPDVAIARARDGTCTVEIRGVDVFDPTSGAVRAGGVDDIACWFVDTDYDEESFFVRHAYFLGGKDPYEKLKRTLKAEIDESAWATLYSAKSRPFPVPKSGRIAVKVINHYGDEVLKVFRVPAG